MKKITSFLMMFMLFVGMGWAQTEATIPDDGVYKIHWKFNNRGFLTYCETEYPNEAQLAGVGANVGGSNHYNLETDKDKISLYWYLYTSPKGNKYLFTAKDGKFLGIGTAGAGAGVANVLDKTKPTPITIEVAGYNKGGTTAKEYLQVKSGNRVFGSGSGSTKANHPVRWNNLDQVNDEGTPLSFIKEGSIEQSVLNAAIATVADFEDVPTLNFMDTETGNTFAIPEVALAEGDVKSQLASLHLLDGYYTVNSCDPATYTKGVKTIVVNVTSNFPFATTTVENGHFANGTQWNYLKNKSDKDVVYNANGQITTLANTKAFNKESLWAFVKVSGNPYEFKIYNFENGASKPLGLNGEDAKFEGCDANTDVFVLSQNDTGFALRCKSKTKGFLGSHRNYNGANNALGIWSGGYTTEEGSRFHATQLTEDEINNQLENLPTLTYAADAGENVVSTYTAEQAKTISDNKAQYTTDKSMDALSVLFEALEWTQGSINVNKFYQLISYDNVESPTKGHPLYCDDYCDKDGGNTKYGARKLYVGPHANLMNTAFRFEKDGANYRVEHVNTKYWFADLKNFSDLQALDLPTQRGWGGPSAITNARNYANVWAISNVAGDKWIHSGGALVSGQDYSQAICRTESPATNDGNLWVIREITEVPVAVGTAKWATLCLPMPVTVPNNADLHVYYVSDVLQGGKMVLSEIQKGTTIAKETPVLLYSTSAATSDNFTFAVNVEAQAQSYADVNKLSGSTARRWGFNENNVKDAANIPTPYYALGNKGKVAFYPSTSNTVAANKAYLLKSKVPANANASSLYFYFGDVTGIENTPVQESKEVKYYDLSGKRVFYPSNGVFITSEGKKVFIK